MDNQNQRVTEQAKFEEWAELTQAQKHGAQHDVTGWYYFDEVTQDRWDAWQARAALTRQAAPEAPTDEQIIAALHANGIDTYPSKYGFDAVQVSATSVPSLRKVFESLATPAATTASASESLDEYLDREFPSIEELRRRAPAPSQEAAQAAPAGADTDRINWLIANHRWSVRWRIHTKKQIEQWQMVDDGEPWGQWGEYRQVLDAAIAASAKEKRT
jgi:hypothetical protein